MNVCVSIFPSFQYVSALGKLIFYWFLISPLILASLLLTYLDWRHQLQGLVDPPGPHSQKKKRVRFSCALCAKVQAAAAAQVFTAAGHVDVLLCFVVLAVCELLFLYSAEPLRRTTASDWRDISHQTILRWAGTAMESCRVDKLWRCSKSARFKELNVSSQRIRRAWCLRAAGRQVSLKDATNKRRN